MTARPLYELVPGAPEGGISGGDYIWRAEATNWNGATARLRHRKLDGVTWADVLDPSAVAVTLSADGQKAIGIGQGAVLDISFSGGTPVGFKSFLAGLG